jgi:hypothetical protein
MVAALEFSEAFLRKIAEMGVLLCLLPGACGAGTVPGLQAPAAVHDFGRVRVGVPVTHAFPFVNTGPGPVRILELRPECGCLTARASRTRLERGEAGEVLVTFVPLPWEGMLENS